VRRWLLRNTLAQLRTQRRLQQVQQAQERATRCIQGVVLPWWKRRQEQRHTAACDIQALVRGWLIRRGHGRVIQLQCQLERMQKEQQIAIQDIITEKRLSIRAIRQERRRSSLLQEQVQCELQNTMAQIQELRDDNKQWRLQNTKLMNQYEQLWLSHRREEGLQRKWQRKLHAVQESIAVMEQQRIPEAQHVQSEFVHVTQQLQERYELVQERCDHETLLCHRYLKTIAEMVQLVEEQASSTDPHLVHLVRRLALLEPTPSNKHAAAAADADDDKKEQQDNVDHDKHKKPVKVVQRKKIKANCTRKTSIC